MGVTPDSMKEPMCTHVTPRGSTYYYRRKTPIDLIHLFGKEVMKSLGTKDKQEACKLGRAMGLYWDSVFDEARAKMANPHSPISEAAPQSPAAVKESWDDGFTIQDAHIYAAKLMNRLRSLRESSFAKGELWLFQSHINNMEADAKEYLKTGIHPFEDAGGALWKAEQQIKVVKALRKNKDLPYMEVRSEKIAASPASNPIPQSDSLASLIPKWKLERSPRPQTVSKMESIIGSFEAIVGHKSIQQVVKSDIVKFKDVLLEKEKKTPVNVNHYLNVLNTLFNFAVGQAVIETNPAKGVSIVIKENPKSKRQAFELDELQHIFNSPIYTEGFRPIGGKGEAAYWLPLLALYTGARLEELAQLTTRDVLQENYVDDEGTKIPVWVLKFTNEGDEQQVKNFGSIRRVPLHSELIKLGFLDYVKGIKDGRIFPEFKSVKDGAKLSASWSKWFNKLLREKLEITDTRKVFYSFRHTFKDNARAIGILKEINDAFTGHTSGDVADNYGSDNYPLRPLAEAMAKYKLIGLKLPTKP